MLDGCVAWPPEMVAQYRRAGYWQDRTLAELVRATAAREPDRTALVRGSRRISYGHLDQWADRLAGGMARLGVREGDRVVVQLPNVPEFVAVSLALFRLGALPVYALPAHRRSEVAHLCEHTGAVAYVLPDVVGGFDFREQAREVRAAVSGLRHLVVAGEAGGLTALAELDGPPVTVRPEPAEVAFFLLSGGTTGVPKLIPRTHRDYAYQLSATAAELGFDHRGVYLAALPVGHNAALGCPGVLGALWVGGRVVLANSPSPDEVFPLIAREGVTLTTLMPAYLPLWMDLREFFDVDLSRLTVEVGGAPLAPSVAERVDRVLGCTLTRWFGMAEGLLVFTRPQEPAEVRAATEGRPLSAHDELRIVDEQDRPVAPGETGELLARGPCVIRGYYRAAEYNAGAFTPDGFLRTGDLVRLDEAGRLVVTGRVKDVVNRGGEKVPPAEVEGHLLHHPQVREVAIVGLPDARLGEKTCAVVVASGAGAPTLASLRQLLAERGLAEFKFPDQLEIVEQLPRTGLGKVDKRAAAALVSRR